MRKNWLTGKPYKSLFPILAVMIVAGAIGYCFFSQSIVKPREASYVWSTEEPDVKKSRVSKAHSNKAVPELKRNWKSAFGVFLAISALVYAFGDYFQNLIFVPGNFAAKFLISAFTLLSAIALVKEAMKVWATYETSTWLLPLKNLLLSAKERATADRIRNKSWARFNSFILK